LEETAFRVRAVESSADLDAFLSFPHIRYRDDPSWIAPVGSWLRHRVRPFLRTCHLRLFLARRGEEVLGTISVLRDTLHESHRGDPTAFFGFFETVDDPAVARALLEAAAGQARSWGLTRLRGPRNLTRVEDIGVTVEGFETRPPFLQGHHPPTYGPFIEAAGFVKHRDMFAYETPLVEADGTPRALPDKLRIPAEAVSIPGLEIRMARYRSLSRDLGTAYTVFVEAFRDLPENTPMPRDQFVALGKAFLLVADDRLLWLATVNGQPAGFALVFPEINEAVAPMGGRVAPFGWVRGIQGFRSRQTASFKLIGVMKEHRASGLHSRMIVQAVLGAQAAGYRRLEASIIDEGNPRMRHIAESLGCRIYRVYRVYDREV